MNPKIKIYEISPAGVEILESSLPKANPCGRCYRKPVDDARCCGACYTCCYEPVKKNRQHCCDITTRECCDVYCGPDESCLDCLCLPLKTAILCPWYFAANINHCINQCRQTGDVNYLC